jgi:hypothetical protein
VRQAIDDPSIVDMNHLDAFVDVEMQEVDGELPIIDEHNDLYDDSWFDDDDDDVDLGATFTQAGKPTIASSSLPNGTATFLRYACTNHPDAQVFATMLTQRVGYSRGFATKGAIQNVDFDGSESLRGHGRMFSRPLSDRSSHVDITNTPSGSPI